MESPDDLEEKFHALIEDFNAVQAENGRLRQALEEWLTLADVNGTIPRVYVERTHAALRRKA